MSNRVKVWLKEQVFFLPNPSRICQFLLTNTWQYISLHKSNKTTIGNCVVLLTRVTRIPYLRETCLGFGCHQRKKNWDRLWKLIEVHCRNSLVSCLITWFMAIFPDRERRLFPWKMENKKHQDIFGNLKSLINLHKPIGIEGKACWQLWLGFLPCGPKM